MTHADTTNGERSPKEEPVKQENTQDKRRPSIARQESTKVAREEEKRGTGTAAEWEAEDKGEDHRGTKDGERSQRDKNQKEPGGK